MRGGMVSCAVAVFVVAACSGGADSACGDYVDALNGASASCGSAPVYSSTDRASFQVECAAIARAPGAASFPSNVGQCAGDVRQADCDTIDRTIRACKLHGTLPDGAACASPAQCAGGICVGPSTVDLTTELQCGTCASYVALGGSCNPIVTCDPPNGQCSGPDICDPATGACSPTQLVCVAYGDVGVACVGDETCKVGLTCVANKCAPFPTKGEACTEYCAWPYACMSGTCADAAPIPTVAVGQACGLVNGNVVGCEPGVQCVYSGSGSSGICTAPVPKGGVCTVGFSQCAVGYLCISGVCQTPDYTLCK